MKFNVIVTSNKKHAELICDLLKDKWSLHRFRIEENGSITHRIVNDDATLYTSEAAQTEIKWFAQGALSALKAHCAL